MQNHTTAIHTGTTWIDRSFKQDYTVLYMF